MNLQAIIGKRRLAVLGSKCCKTCAAIFTKLLPMARGKGAKGITEVVGPERVWVLGP